MDGPSFLACVQELEDLVPVELKPVVRRISIHVVRLEQDLNDLREEHTDPDTGRPFDVRGAYKALGTFEEGMVSHQNRILTLETTMLKAFWWARGIGALLGILMLFSMYVLKDSVDTIRENAKINHQQNIVLERLQTRIEDGAKNHP